MRLTMDQLSPTHSDMTANLYGNSPEVIRKHYFLGIDLDKATQILNQI